MKVRDHIYLYINKQEYQISGKQVFMMLADFLRYEVGLAGTKVVCAEGDCGACTVLVANASDLDSSKNRMPQYKAFNACILPMYNLDSCHVVTIEGAQLTEDQLHPVQDAMIKCHGSQCGYCTPGIVNSMVSCFDDCINTKKEFTSERVKNYLTGNLCRCTGYKPILDAADTISNLFNANESMTTWARFQNFVNWKLLQQSTLQSVKVMHENLEIFMPVTTQEAIDYKSKNLGSRIVNGATDIGVLVNKGKLELTQHLSLKKISDLKKISILNSIVRVGAQVSLTDLQEYLKSQVQSSSLELENLLKIFASPQIKNAGSLVGNVMNASPIGDLIPAMLIMNAKVIAASVKGERKISLNELYQGYKKLATQNHEIVIAIEFALPIHFMKLYKVSLRKDLDISAVTFAASLEIKNDKVMAFNLALGGVSPVVSRMTEVEKLANGQTWNLNLISDLSQKIESEIKPISDVRGSEEYRRKVIKNLLRKFYAESIRETI